MVINWNQSLLKNKTEFEEMNTEADLVVLVAFDWWRVLDRPGLYTVSARTTGRQIALVISSQPESTSTKDERSCPPPDWRRLNQQAWRLRVRPMRNMLLGFSVILSGSFSASSHRSQFHLCDCISRPFYYSTSCDVHTWINNWLS